MLAERTFGKLKVLTTESRKELGELAARSIELKINELLQHKREIRMVFAAAPSQDEMLASLTASGKIEWDRITVFHMDEYIGLPKEAPQLFQEYLNLHLFSKVPFRKVHLIDSETVNVLEECRRYTELISSAPIDIICMGIGENGHIAFNDPGVADFEDREVFKIAKLDGICRRQQVNDGCFHDIRSVPRYAYTLTVPTLFSASHLFVSVPGIRKAEAVRKTLTDVISDKCPSTILRRHPDATLFLDQESSSSMDSED